MKSRRRKKKKTDSNIREIKDNGYKRIFDEPELFCQFIRDFIDNDYLKNIQPNDIEDYTNIFFPIHSNRRETDTVKVIKIKETLTVVLVEHQSEVNYLMPFRILEYMVLIWNKWIFISERAEKGQTTRKDFKLPPIIPIVYFSSQGRWTAELNIFDKIAENEIFKKYIPAFSYELVSLSQYTIEDLMKFEDMLSFIFLIDKIKKPDEIKGILDSINDAYISNIKEKIPENLLELLSMIIAGFLAKINIPENEIKEVKEQIHERRFENMLSFVEKYDVQETRRVSKEEGHEEGRKRGQEEGIDYTLLVVQDLRKQVSLEEIARKYNISIDKISQIKSVFQNA